VLALKKAVEQERPWGKKGLGQKKGGTTGGGPHRLSFAARSVGATFGEETEHRLDDVVALSTSKILTKG
jgi:hypothetical protein